MLLDFYKGKITGTRKVEDVLCAVIKPRSRHFNTVIAPLFNGGMVTFLGDGHPWINRGTLPCIPPDGTEVYYTYHPDRFYGFPTATLWCETTEWDNAIWDIEDLFLRMKDHETTDLMIPEEFEILSGLHRTITCSSRPMGERPPKPRDESDENTILTWVDHLFAPVPVC